MRTFVYNLHVHLEPHTQHTTACTQTQTHTFKHNILQHHYVSYPPTDSQRWHCFHSCQHVLAICPTSNSHYRNMQHKNTWSNLMSSLSKFLFYFICLLIYFFKSYFFENHADLI